MKSTLDPLLALGRPFTPAMARDLGVPDRVLRAGVLSGALAHPVRGVYHGTALEDSLDLRCACLRLIVPPGAVVTDRLAGWLHGAPRILAPGAHLEVPLLNVFCAPGNRLRNPLVASGERDLPESDLQMVHGLVVTTPVRTTCDLGRLLHVDQALAAIDSMLRTGKVTKPALMEAMHRFKGYRGVVQLRRLVPLGDGRSQSPGESILRLRWIDCELPPPVLQLEVAGPDGPYFLDLADPDSLFAAEYDGEEFHGPAQLAYDLGRRQWMSDHEAWHLLVARKEHMVGPAQPIYGMLNAGYYTAVSRPQRQFLPGRWSPPR